MEEKFLCKNCRRLYLKNPRIKGIQQYCNSKECQQKRKNNWERKKIAQDPAYKQNRRSQKKNWYKNKPGYEYQREYRQKHSSYSLENVIRQNIRNQASYLKILHDIQRSNKDQETTNLYYLIPYNKHSKNIVKTDALVVSINCLPAP